MSTVAISRGASAALSELAKYHGVSRRELVEALLHYAASQMERPGSWEAQVFDIANYAPDGLADRWFTADRCFVEPVV